MLTRLALLPLNRLLQEQAWAGDLLRPHAGKGAELAIGNASLKFLVSIVSDSAQLEALPADTPIAVRIALPASALTQLPLSVETLTQQAQISGDAGFAEVISQLLRHLRPDVGAALSPLIGQVLAHRVEQGATRVAAGAQDAVQRVTSNVREYVGEGVAPAVSRSELAQWSADIARFEQQLQQLETRAARLTETR